MNWCIKLKASSLLLAFILYMVLAVVMIEKSKAEALEEWTNLGNVNLTEFLELYLGQDDKGEADYEIDVWIDGWTDGLISVYVYEGVIGVESSSALDACLDGMGPESMRKGLLSLALEDETKHMSVSKILYVAIRLNCEDVLGEYNDDEDTSS